MTRIFAGSLSIAALIAASGCGSSESIPDECVDLCARAPGAGIIQGACVDDFFSTRYDTNTLECNELSGQFGAGQASASTCRACADSIGASGSHCAQAEQMCFGGGGGSPDAGNGGGGIDAGGTPVVMACPGGGCEQTCTGGNSCEFSCAGGGCSQTCAGGSACDLSCTGGTCSQNCAQDANCTASCTVNCTQTCNVGSEACTFSCNSGCVQQCAGNPNCTATCQQICG